MNALRGIVVLCAVFATACSSQSRKLSSDHPSDNDTQAMMGFRLEIKTADGQLYSFRDQGTFLISREGMTTRKAAMSFCAAHDKYELSDFLLPGVITISGLSFEELQKSNATKESVLSGRGGYVFWIVGKDEKEEATLKQKEDMFYALLNGCGPGCDAALSLGDVNRALKKLKKPALAPLAICVDPSLKENLNKH